MIISISGKSGSGKDLATGLIKELYPNYNWETKKFAFKLKQIVGILTGKTVEELELPEVKNSKLSSEWGVFRSDCIMTSSYDEMKSTLQSLNKCTYGLEKNTDLILSRVSEDPTDYWMIPTYRQALQWVGTEAMRDVLHPNVWCLALFSDYNYDSNWIINDTRFPNEIEFAKQKDAMLIRLEREGLKLMDHTSETALDKYQGFDVVIHNNGTIKDLKINLKKFLDSKLIP